MRESKFAFGIFYPEIRKTCKVVPYLFGGNCVTKMSPLSRRNTKLQIWCKTFWPYTLWPELYFAANRHKLVEGSHELHRYNGFGGCGYLTGVHLVVESYFCKCFQRIITTIFKKVCWINHQSFSLNFCWKEKSPRCPFYASPTHFRTICISHASSVNQAIGNHGNSRDNYLLRHKQTYQLGRQSGIVLNTKLFEDLTRD